MKKEDILFLENLGFVLKNDIFEHTEGTISVFIIPLGFDRYKIEWYYDMYTEEETYHFELSKPGETLQDFVNLYV